MFNARDFSETVRNSTLLYLYTMSQKDCATITIAITLSILDGFAKFIRCCKDQ